MFSKTDMKTITTVFRIVSVLFGLYFAGTALWLVGTTVFAEEGIHGQVEEILRDEPFTNVQSPLPKHLADKLTQLNASPDSLEKLRVLYNESAMYSEKFFVSTVVLILLPVFLLLLLWFSVYLIKLGVVGMVPSKTELYFELQAAKAKIDLLQAKLDLPEAKKDS
jgi:hypothetical protein